PRFTAPIAAEKRSKIVEVDGVECQAPEGRWCGPGVVADVAIIGDDLDGDGTELEERLAHRMVVTAGIANSATRDIEGGDGVDRPVEIRGGDHEVVESGDAVGVRFGRWGMA